MSFSVYSVGDVHLSLSEKEDNKPNITENYFIASQKKLIFCNRQSKEIQVFAYYEAIKLFRVKISM